ncbi:sugar transferase [Aliiroseovarius sp. F47248L]|uniref:sugar transferase n=1 Tax=Aliiroseovarius sp. F47248L TaxID=2926420 RepID=UPI001FF489F6|nr:sugar transferase [Aliiroseovarius sp. F47248L]MCK0140571.1 sugar transferase [Aliiroseovarius sp. F47248L]
MTTHFKDFSGPSTKLVKRQKFYVADSSVRPYRDRFKRLLDIAFVVASAPIAIPLIGIMLLLAALDGGKPLYRQRRIGKDGRIYNMVKIRSMVMNADQRLEAYLDSNPEARAEWDSTQKLKNDPRITKIGKFLRKSSMDELPQLWNVLVGDMSIVGPRPMMEDQKTLYPGAAYYAMRPGITGPWQVSDRNETTFAQRATFDTKYYYELSLKKDFEILGQTVGVVLRCTGH